MLKVTETVQIDFPFQLISQFDEIIKRYPEGKQKSALLPLLHLVQAEYGWLSTASMDQLAHYLDIKPIEVYEVATFYTMFFFKTAGQICFGSMPYRTMLFGRCRKYYETYRNFFRC